MPKGSNSRGSDDDYQFRRKGEDFNFDIELKGKDKITKEKRKGSQIYINAEILPVENFIIPIQHFTIIAKNLMEENSLRTPFTMVKYSKALPRTEEDHA